MMFSSFECKKLTYMLPIETRFFYTSVGYMLSGKNRTVCSEIEAELIKLGLQYEEMDIMETHLQLNIPRIENPRKYGCNEDSTVIMYKAFLIESEEAIKHLMPVIVITTTIN